MHKMKQILLRREYAGYILDVLAMLVGYELTEPYRVLLLLAIVFGGLPLARKRYFLLECK